MSTSTSSPAHEAALEAAGAQDLQRAYIWAINSAIERGGDILADELADSYRHESRELARRRARPLAA